MVARKLTVAWIELSCEFVHSRDEGLEFGSHKPEIYSLSPVARKVNA